MTTDVKVLRPDMSIEEAADDLRRYRLHGAPVVDWTEQLVGMVSVVDLAGRSEGTVLDVMRPHPVTATEDTPVQEIAALMLNRTVRRVPIVRSRRVIGIVSASDVIRAFLRLHEMPPGGLAQPPAARSGGRAGG